MYKLIDILIVLTVFLLHSLSAQAFEVEEEFYELSPRFHYFVDENANLTLNDILSPEVQTRFQSSSGNHPQRDNINAALWLKLELTFSPSKLDQPYILTALINNFNEISIFRPNNNGQYQEPFVTGNTYPASQREIQSSRYSFEINPNQNAQTIYIRTIGSIDTFQLPWMLVEHDLFEANSRHYWIINLFSLGILIGVTVLCLGIGVILPSKSYLVYSAFLISGLVSLSNLDGLTFMLLWPNTPALNEYAVDVINIAIAITRFLTIVLFLDIRTRFPLLFRYCFAWIIFLGITFVFAATTGLKSVSEIFGGILWLISMLLGLGLVAFGIIRKLPLALTLFVILLIPLLGSLYQAAVSVGLLEISVLSLQSAKLTFVIHAILFSVCLARQMQLQIETKLIAQHDNLTGLPRLVLAKQFFQHARELADEHQWKVGVLFIDLDGFKPVNDTYGHKTGDILLIEVAARIQQCLREVDTAARIGGDEFMVIQTEVKDDTAYEVVAKNIQQVLSQPFLIHKHHISISASIGIAFYPDHGNDLTELMKQADGAMYQGKNTGKNQYTIATIEVSGNPDIVGDHP
ncbi:diguanylate cyclase [Oceanicoccus sp. KOV_DT_Chl]|uniref:diguanylate cyclase n=1 Tax=Oceanicoccus sp. KOV_DT_Chl TaxID=1904639 RepID=UPI000C7CCECA|nr:diguanylate cyclase [Oceanicoccus sp. KOV_DT_Chl]